MQEPDEMAANLSPLPQLTLLAAPALTQYVLIL